MFSFGKEINNPFSISWVVYSSYLISGFLSSEWKNFKFALKPVSDKYAPVKSFAFKNCNESWWQTLSDYCEIK